MLRLLLLEVAPMFSVAVISYRCGRSTPVAFTIAALLSLTNVALSIRDGAALVRLGRLVERKKDGWLFWFAIVAHALVPVGLLCVGWFPAYTKGLTNR